jgi:glyoxylate reductase
MDDAVTAPRPLLCLARALPGLDEAALTQRFEVRAVAPEGGRAALVAAVGEAEVAIVSYLDRVDEPLLAAAPRLRHVASYGVGVNHVDLAACRRRGVVVTNTPGILTDATADHAMALLLAAARRVAEGDRVIRAGAWTTIDPGWLLGTQVTGKTVGVVGFGRIGQAFARRAAGFGLRVIYAGPREVEFPGARRAPLEALLAESDFVSLHVPLTPATEDLLSRARIALMKRGAVLVNTARGQVVDDAALAEALADGRLAAAGLDVFRDEPRVPAAYLSLPNVVLTPHLGSGSRETRWAMSQLVLDDVLRVARGEAPRHPVA